jgi:nicotinate phosphoribosyltransferase
VKIVLSSDLDEYEIDNLVANGDFDTAGVGTRLATSDDAPSLGGVYKLTRIDGRPVAKFAEGKVTFPGAHQVYRVQQDGRFVFDWLGLEQEPGYDFVGTTPLLVPAMRRGRLEEPFAHGGSEIIEVMRARCRDGLERLPDVARVVGPRGHIRGGAYDVRPTPALMALLEQVKNTPHT